MRPVWPAVPRRKAAGQAPVPAARAGGVLRADACGRGRAAVLQVRQMRVQHAVAAQRADVLPAALRDSHAWV